MMKGRTRWLMLTLALLVSGVILGGCATGRGDGAPTGEQNRPAELVLAIGGEPEAGFDPVTGWGRNGSPLFHSTLLARDNRLAIVNDLATEHTVSADGLTWTVTIRQDARFSDGEPVTAADVAYTFEAASKSGAVIDLTVMESVRAVDDHTVEFKLKKPQSTFVNQLIRMGIVPRHAHGDDYAQNPVGSGPYKFVQWDKGQQLIVERNPYYYGPSPHFERLTFLFMAEDAAFAAAKAGQVDVVSVPQAFATQSVEGMRLVAIDSVDSRGIMFPMVAATQRTSGFQIMFTDHEEEVPASSAAASTRDGRPLGHNVTADVAIRQAINYAIDRDALVEGVLEGFGTPAYTQSDNMPWSHPDTVIEDGDTVRAKSILADAGWQDRDGDGILDKGDLKAQFTLLYPVGDKTRQALALAVADMIRPIGIDIRPEGQGWEEIEKRMHSEAVLFGWGSHDPIEMYNLYSSQTRGVEWFNPGFYSNPVVDEYMNKALAAPSEAEALEYWKKAQWDGTTGLSARGDAPWAWLVNLDHCYFIRDGLDVGEQRVTEHGHGWQITANVVQWVWSE